MLDDLKKIVTEEKEEKKKIFRRSIVLNKNLEEGDIITKEDIALKRPGTGFLPDDIKFIIGKKLKRDLEADYILTENDIA